MLKNYRFKPIAFSSFHTTQLGSTAKIYYRILHSRLKEYLLHNYDGKIVPYGKDDIWYNLIIIQRGITVDFSTRQTFEILETTNFTNLMPAIDIDYINTKTENKFSFDKKVVYELNFMTIPLLIGTYLSIYFNSLSELMRLRKVFPGSYLIRAFLNDLLQALVTRLTSQIINNNHSVNKIIAILKSSEDLLLAVFETIKEKKELYVTNSRFKEQVADYYSVYDYSIFINTLANEHRMRIFNDIVKDNNKHSARVYIASQIKKHKGKTDPQKLFKLAYDLIMNYIIYSQLLSNRYSNFLIEQHIEQNIDISDIEFNNSKDKERIVQLADELIEKTLFKEVYVITNDKQDRYLVQTIQ